ncbi:uncharacterized protein FIBRA_05080 [Fibroporia radiculosa]|uniref:Uncharacterized protein n=1 Tax=Fibroporia radiculosa TaxID=599839 RepID=J4GQC9_9APHY|nr:uncharacterized protein FIBRA_05080 [Fibroporia radiculosa]CCM02965.1 predicted protein [Fibroporia radiculosa]
MNAQQTQLPSVHLVDIPPQGAQQKQQELPIVNGVSPLTTQLYAKPFTASPQIIPYTEARRDGSACSATPFSPFLIHSGTDPSADDTGTWTSISDTRTSSSSYWEPDPHGDAPNTDTEPSELRESFSFRGAQYDVQRTILRPNPRFALPPRSSAPGPPAPLQRDSAAGDATDADDAPREMPPRDAAARGVKRVTEWRNFEEDVAFREHEYLLEQAGCGRVEIWVTEERRQQNGREGEGRPRVFFPLLSPSTR